MGTLQTVMVTASLLNQLHALTLAAKTVVTPQANLAVLNVVSDSLSVGTLNGGYLRKVPLHRAPQIQSLEYKTCHMQVTRDNPNTCYSQVPRIPT
jgi:hypothetical protein